MEFFLIAMALFAAFSNGANDNFKGFATVWGSNTLSYRQALILATVATVAGSLVSWLFATTLVQEFSGKGLVPDLVANSPNFLLSVAGGAGMTVFLATRIGLPVSTTHALIGGLVGAGLAQTGGEVHFAKLGSVFLLPLLASPLVAASLGAVGFSLLRLRRTEKDCACVTTVTPAAIQPTDTMAFQSTVIPRLVIAEPAECLPLVPQASFSVTRLLDRLHVASAISICFARGVNDTPKLAALLLAAHWINGQLSVGVIGMVMAIGGFVFARQVAETMSQRVTRMDSTQGLAANLITASLVLFASKWGFPVSTTHVSVGAIAGVGASASTLNPTELRNIMLSWIATLPLAMIISWTLVKVI